MEPESKKVNGPTNVNDTAPVGQNSPKAPINVLDMPPATDQPVIKHNYGEGTPSQTSLNDGANPQNTPIQKFSPPSAGPTNSGRQYTPPGPAFPQNDYVPNSSSGSTKLGRKFGSKNHHKGLGLLITLLILLACAATVYALVLAPNAAITNAIGKFQSSSFAHTEFKINAESDLDTMKGATLLVVSDTDRSNTANQRSAYRIDLQTPQTSLTGEFRIYGGQVYFQLIKLDPRFGAPDSALNHWYSASLSKLSLFGSASLASSTTTMKPISLGNISAEGVFASQSFSGFGLDNGMPVRLYTLKIDSAKLGAYISKIFASNVAVQDSKELDNIKTGIQLIVSSIDFAPIYVSTDLLTGAPRTIKTDITLTKSLILPNLAKPVILHISSTFNDKDLGIMVEPPSESTSIDNYLDYGVSGLNPFGDSRQKGMDARVIADVQQIRIALESGFDGKKYDVKTCTTGVGATLLADAKQNTTKFGCNVGPTTYSIYGLLGAPTDSSKPYFCIDSTGATQQLSKAPTGYSCK